MNVLRQPRSRRAPLYRGCIAVAWLLAWLVACAGAPSPPIGKAQPTPSAQPSATPVGCKHEPTRPLFVGGNKALRRAVKEHRQAGIIPVAVTIDGCEMNLEVLEGCFLPRVYSYRGELERASTTVRDRAQLFQDMPLVAVAMEESLRDAAVLRVDEHRVGVFSVLDDEALARSELQGEGCNAATHFIRRMTVGGFAAARGTATELSSLGDLLASDSAAVFQRAGDPSACATATVELESPPTGCGEPLVISLGGFAAEKATIVDPENECAHTLCKEGAKLAASCGKCTERVCNNDAYCCTNKWDISCVERAVTECRVQCDGVVPTCSGGRIWNRTACVCSKGRNWNGTECIIPATCKHDVCVTGGPLKVSCTACSKAVCEIDSYCCENDWDQRCLDQVASTCAESCSCEQGMKGKCNGTVVTFCLGGRITRRDCKKNPRRPLCGLNPTTQFAHCIQAPNTKPRSIAPGERSE